ncbi:PfkB family carbohydrate kinase [Luteimonas saliphila]|uniref:PfkB family carbohydrate kinase n=1 Tax=Luteimonas saliphila TaxID=2804919 RepID=UPI001EE1A048|nr:PfkB family carbohydrate kinase [Luteimonas saliphila]
MMLSIVGGVYRERCMRPDWDQVVGSAGRAAMAIHQLGGRVHLHSHLDDQARAIFSAVDELKLTGPAIAHCPAFFYLHGLARPVIHRIADLADLELEAEKIIRFGMLDATAVVKATYAVFDPQNAEGIERFGQNGSTADHLALVLNRDEAARLLDQPDVEPAELAQQLAEHEAAEVVVIKMGPQGALVWHSGAAHQVPAYETPFVWKIGSGDQFVAHFAYAWMEEGREPVEAADRASRATAYYCQYRGFPNQRQLDSYHPDPVEVSDRFKSRVKPPRVYLAGPFFSLGQLWMVDQARDVLRNMGLTVFSPYHDVGVGPANEVVQQDLDGIADCDLMFAICDGMDPGTIFEIGYARRMGMPVIVYAETEGAEASKMMVGTGCYIRSDFVSAIYQTAWVGAKL